MNQSDVRAFAQSVALYAMYLLRGYEANMRYPDKMPALQEQVGHIGVADRIASLAAVTVDYMQGEGAALVDSKYQGMDFPGVFEYEVMEALGSWLADESTCTDAEYRAGLARQFTIFMDGCPTPGASPSTTEGQCQ